MTTTLPEAILPLTANTVLWGKGYFSTLDGALSNSFYGLHYLYSRYGNFSDVSSQELDDFIKYAPKHDGHDNKHLENIHKFLGMILIFRQEHNVEKFTFQKTREALNKILPTQTLQSFWKEFLELSDKYYQIRCADGTAPPVDEWKSVWEGDNYLDIRLDFVQNFLSKYLNLMRCLPDPRMSKPGLQINLKNGPVPFVNPNTYASTLVRISLILGAVRFLKLQTQSPN